MIQTNTATCNTQNMESESAPHQKKTTRIQVLFQNLGLALTSSRTNIDSAPPSSLTCLLRHSDGMREKTSTHTWFSGDIRAQLSPNSMLGTPVGLQKNKHFSNSVSHDHVLQQWVRGGAGVAASHLLMSMFFSEEPSVRRCSHPWIKTLVARFLSPMKRSYHISTSSL